MATPIRLEDVQLAWQARDPETVALVVDLARQDDPEPETPLRPGAPTFAAFLAEIRSKAFRAKPRDVQASERQAKLRALEAPDAELPLPDRFKLHTILEELWADGGPIARSWLLRIIAQIPARYGPWKALKRIFKEAEARGDAEVFAALAARFDEMHAEGVSEVGRATLAYLRRRGWRALRRAAERLPASYPDLACDVLACYGERTNWTRTWIANQIFFHEAGGYGKDEFSSPVVHSSDLLKHRAYPDLWKRTPRPLFGLLEKARNDRPRRFAAEALKADFRASLREVEPAWVARLVDVSSEPVDALIVWILTNVPRFEQSAFRSLGLHEPVLKLFDSPSQEARTYAAGYARTHARDLPVDELIRLTDNDNQAVRKLAADLLGDRDPRTEVGLEAWGRLLNTQHGAKLAGEAIRKNFGAKELSPDWFRDHLLTDSREAFGFLKDLLARLHPTEKLGAGFFRDLIVKESKSHVGYQVLLVPFAMGELARFDLNEQPADFLRRLLLNRSTQTQTVRWVEEGKLKVPTLGVDFLKALAYEPDFGTNSWIAEFRRTGPEWARKLSFDQGLSDKVRAWLADVRKVPPADLGFDWLLSLAARSEPAYHDFAVSVLTKGFTPADFAPREAPATTAQAAGPVDLKGASFLFTGKMATLKRKDGEDQVKAAGGTTASGVNAKLHYLVIGDEGSPLYGHGKKGDKQTKAESLNAAGANIKIISETAFLKMLAGGVQEVSTDAVMAGCERLWQMATAPGPADAPKARFAVEYILKHHPDIALAKTERPVDPGAEIPAEFLTFERVEPLFYESRKPLRDLALELARWEFARWAPPSDALVRLAESPHADVHRFVTDALLAEEAPEHRRFRIDPESLSPAAVYAFCESADASTRDLGMQLIGRSPRLRRPEELFRLTDSPDRRMRAFVIRALWSLYRDRGITEGWKPSAPPSSTIGAGTRKAAAAAAENRGTGAPARPDNLPAQPTGMWGLLRRSLFELPPPRPEKGEKSAGGEKLKPLPARKAKLAMIEVIRDLALEDVDFARGALPLLEEFLPSRGPSERAACLTAVTRIRHVWPELRRRAEEAAS
ncbi:BRCT domain-containing protein [Paludisphaera rhizosphaerae]|uniref:BRCT domain-containing protein n=1 Tax=Paludisphaera rhizosphaerae TaxID=2711216 RepID=UPI0013EB2AD9|nr:BRCT domain-containing protein [Paludisphaera rhizosphaerae]